MWPSIAVQWKRRAVQIYAVTTLLFCLPSFASISEAKDAQLFRAQPGENITLHTAWNFEGKVWVRIVNSKTGAPATAKLWSVGLFQNYDHGTFSGSAVIDVWGLRDELRAGHINEPTLFLVTASGSVWQTISDGKIEAACRFVGLECPLPDLP